MTFAVKTFANGQLPSSAAALYTASGEACYIKNLVVSNLTGGALDVTLWKRSGAVDTPIMNESVAAGSCIIGTGFLLEDGESIRGVASAATSVDYLIDGISET